MSDFGRILRSFECPRIFECVFFTGFFLNGCLKSQANVKIMWEFNGEIEILYYISRGLEVDLDTLIPGSGKATKQTFT